MWNFFVIMVPLIVDFKTISSAEDLPSYVTICKRNDPDISKCILKNVDQLRSRFKTGIPELFIPSLDPLRIPEATLSSDSNFKASFRNIELFNAYNFKLKNFDVDFDKNHVNMQILFPSLRIKSIYSINGRLLVLNLNGKGPADGNYTNVQGSLSLKGIPFHKRNQEYIRWEKEKIDIKIEKIHLFFDKIFGDNQELNDQTNRVINENIETIVAELEPVIQQIVTDFIFGLVNRLFAKFSVDELFPRS